MCIFRKERKFFVFGKVVKCIVYSLDFKYGWSVMWYVIVGISYFGVSWMDVYLVLYRIRDWKNM